MTSLPRRLLRTLQRPLPGSRGLTILAYHLAGADTASPVDLPLARFRRQMEELAASGRVCRLEEWLASPRGDGGAGGAVALTFDDAYRNFYEKVWPILAGEGLPATLFVPVGFVDGESPGPLRDARDLPALSWAELREVAASGLVGIGSHTWTHPDLRRLPGPALAREIGASRKRLEEGTGRPVEGFCYPRGLWSRSLEREVVCSYRWAVLGGGRANRPGSSPYRLSRVPVRRDGPESLEPVLESPVWLEEWLASRLRPLVLRRPA